VDNDLAKTARDRSGLVLSAEITDGQHLGRAAARRHLTGVQPGVWVADTQPVTAPVLIDALRLSVRGEYAVVGAAALWLYGVADEPSAIVVGVPHRTELVLAPPLQVTRISPWMMAGARSRGGVQVVRFEVAVIQAAAKRSNKAVLALLERVLRDRRTTEARLRATLRQGFEGSAVVRRALESVRGGALEREVRELRAALAGRGLHALKVEHRFVNAAGEVCYADLYDEETGTAIEVDGYVWHTDRTRFRADRKRDRWLAGERGVRVLRVDADEVDTDLAALADELVAVLRPAKAA
jgi:very-short-patch-repair endonuclease